MKLTNARHSQGSGATAAKPITPNVSGERVSLRGEWTTLKRVSRPMGGTDVVANLLVLGQVEAQLKATKGLQVELSFQALQKATATSETRTVRTTVDLEPTSTPGYYFGQLSGSGSVVLDVNQGKIASITLNLANKTQFSGARVRSI